MRDSDFTELFDFEEKPRSNHNRYWLEQEHEDSLNFELNFDDEFFDEEEIVSFEEFESISEEFEGDSSKVLLERRKKDRRKKSEGATEGRRATDRRKKQPRRRQIDPTTCERIYTDDEVEFMNALDDYKRSSGRMFPTCSEILEVIRSLGYVKIEKNVTEEEPDDPKTEKTFSDFSSKPEFDPPFVRESVNVDSGDTTPMFIDEVLEKESKESPDEPLPFETGNVPIVIEETTYELETFYEMS